MVQTALNILTGALGTLLHWAWPLGLALLILAVLAALLNRAQTQAYLQRLRWPLLGRWLLATAALGSAWLVLEVSRRTVDARLGQQLGARYSNSADPEGSPTAQASPSVTWLEPHTYTRRLTLPSALYKRLSGGEGWRDVLNYLGEPSDNVQQLRESFSAEGRNLTYNRQQTLIRERPLSLDASKIDTDLKFGSARSNVYTANFNAVYTFTNPQPKPVTARFQFALPTGSGTISGFEMTVEGRVFRGDLDGASTWQGPVGAGQTVTVRVKYQHQGSRGWQYLLASRREAMGAFSLTLRADRAAKFGRYSLYPSRLAGGTFGPRTLEWNFKDILTAQNVSVVFSQTSLRETLSKVQFMAPWALLMAAALSLLWAWGRGLALRPLSWGAALMALSLGFTLGGVLTAYWPPLLAEMAGAALAAGLSTTMLGQAYWPPLLLAAALPMTFLSSGNAALLLALLALAALWVLWRALRPLDLPARLDARAQ